MDDEPQQSDSENAAAQPIRGVVILTSVMVIIALIATVLLSLWGNTGLLWGGLFIACLLLSAFFDGIMPVLLETLIKRAWKRVQQFAQFLNRRGMNPLIPALPDGLWKKLKRTFQILLLITVTWFVGHLLGIR